MGSADFGFRFDESIQLGFGVGVGYGHTVRVHEALFGEQIGGSCMPVGFGVFEGDSSRLMLADERLGGGEGDSK